MAISEDDFGGWAITFCNALNSSTGASSLATYLRKASEGHGNPASRRVLAAVPDTIAQGNPLSAVFAQLSFVFPEAFITSVRYGEIYGEVELTVRRYVERPEERAVRCPMPR